MGYNRAPTQYILPCSLWQGLKPHCMGRIFPKKHRNKVLIFGTVIKILWALKITRRYLKKKKKIFKYVFSPPFPWMCLLAQSKRSVIYISVPDSFPCGAQNPTLLGERVNIWMNERRHKWTSSAKSFLLGPVTGSVVPNVIWKCKVLVKKFLRNFKIVMMEPSVGFL